MIFSNDAVASWLNDHFECAWESVRAVPRIEIDFGNGHHLTRTLNGNIATYFCRPDGGVMDLIPGLVSAEEFLRISRLAVTLEEGLRIEVNPPAALADYHRVMTSPETADAASAPAKIEPSLGISKGIVESPIKHELARRMLRAHADDKRGDTVKRDVEHPVKTVMEDTEYNREHRVPKVHELLARRAGAKPSELTKTVYREILEVDLDDPYLGLAPYVLGGEGGRE